MFWGDLDIHQLLTLEGLEVLDKFLLTSVLKSTETITQLAQGPRKNYTSEVGNKKGKPFTKWRLTQNLGSPVQHIQNQA